MRTPALLVILAACNPDPQGPVDTDETDAPVDTDDTDDTDVVEAPWFCDDGEYVPVAMGDGRWNVVTEHYDLRLARSEAEAAELGRMAEAAWAAWSDEFGAAPDDSDKLRVEWFATTAEWEAAIAADGDPVPYGAGGYYSPNSRAAYLWTQPTIYFNATLFLHELTHQFHLLARTGNQNRAAWYVEGIAEYTSRHDWDGECLRLGRLPLLTQEDNEAQAAASMADGLDLAAVIAGSAGDRPQWEVIWRYLAEDPSTRDGFRAFRDAYDADGGLDVAAAFAEHVGDAAKIGPDIAAWIGGAQEPMTPVYLDWVHVGPDEVRVEPGGVLSIARLKEPTDGFGVVAEEGAPGSAVGVLVGWDGYDDYDVFLVDTNGATSNFAVVDGSVVWTTLGSVPPGEGSVAFDVTWADGIAQIEVNGAGSTVTLSSTPAAGLGTYAADASFYGLRWD